MPNIYYNADKFTGQYVHINTDVQMSIPCRKLDLYRAMITVGSPSFITWNSIRNNGLFRTLSDAIIQKILMVQANIDVHQNELVLHPIFNNYISDQKRIVSYNLGMAFAKIYAERLLEIPNLIHVETLKKTNAVTFIKQTGKTREPDLVGMTSDGNWHVFEAKGMSTNQLSSKLKDAKDQARQIDTIHGQIPSTLSACATYLSNTRVLSSIEDPKSEKEKKIELDYEKYIESYYNQFYSLQDRTQSEYKTENIENTSFKSIELQLDNINLTIGIEEEVDDLIKQKNYDSIKEFYSRRKENSGLRNEGNISLGIDGIIVKQN